MITWLYKLKNHPIFKAWNMSSLKLTDSKVYYKYIKESNYEANVWASNFAYLWSLSQSNNLYVFKALVDNMLVTLLLTKKGRLYLPCLPFGNTSSEKMVHVLIKCGQFCAYWNQHSGYSHKSLINPINQVQLEFLKTSRKYQQYFKEEKLTGIERHYSIQKLTELKGKDFSKVRNKVNKFKRTYPNAIVRSYQADDFNEVMRLGEKWAAKSGKNYRRIIDTHYFEPIIKNHKTLNQIILVVEVNKKIIGLINAEILPTGQAWGCIKKIDKNYPGISEFLTVEIAKKINQTDSKVKYINVGSDLGTKGLAKFKERFRPVLNYERYAIFYRT